MYLYYENFARLCNETLNIFPHDSHRGYISIMKKGVFDRWSEIKFSISHNQGLESYKPCQHQIQEVMKQKVKFLRICISKNINNQLKIAIFSQENFKIVT